MDKTIATGVTTPQYQPLQFTGTARDYFGIWIVNILLTVLTLGIYSAWAKVRRRRYFQGHTILEGHGFGYHATGKQILLGRLLALGLIILLFIPFVNFFAYTGVLAVLPMLYHRSLRFNAQMTSYRNVRFSFQGTTGGAYKAFLLGPLISSMSFGVLMPISAQWQQEYIGNNMMYGDRPFKTEIPITSLYRIWFIPIIFTGFLVATYIVFMIVMINDKTGSIHLFLPFLFMLTYFVTIIAWMVYAVSLRNLAWSHSIFDNKHPIRSTMGRRRYLWIIVTNSIVSIVTFGLMRPWAAVRTARFTWENTAIKFTEDLGEIVSQVEKTGAPMAAEYLDLEGFDFGF
ncbi:YjgN family protein [Bartonella sp. LJL80]